MRRANPACETPRQRATAVLSARLPGGELADSGLADSERAGAAASVGHFLRILHDPGLVRLVDDADLPVDPMRRASAPVRARRAREVLDRLVHGAIYFGFAGKARADLLSAYGRPVGAQRELAARVCAISLAAIQAEYAAADGRDLLLRECVAGLRRAVAA